MYCHLYLNYFANSIIISERKKKRDLIIDKKIFKVKEWLVNIIPVIGRLYISSVSMRGRVRNNYFSVRVDMAQKATFARDAVRCVARAYTFRLKVKNTRLPPSPHAYTHTSFGNRVRQWLPVPTLRGVQLSVWATIAWMNHPPTTLCLLSSFLSEPLTSWSFVILLP